MIKRIKIQNYKLFKSFELEDIPKILLIGGKNNCGKTTFLESLFMALDCGNPSVFIKLLDCRGIHTVNNTVGALFAPSFYDFDLDQDITFEYSINSLKKKLSYKFYPMITQPLAVEGEKIELQKKTDNKLGGLKISYGTENPPKQAFLKAESNEFRLTNKIQYNEGIKVAFIFSSGHNPPEVFSQIYGELDRVNQTEDIVKSLQILEPNLKSLSVIPMGGKPIIYVDTGMRIKIPIPLMGQGMARLLSILLSISEVKKGVILIDELENGFHHSVLPSVWKAISIYAQANKTQIVATTHSWGLIGSAVEGIPEDLRKDFKYIRIEKKQEEFKTKVYDFETLKVALDSELEVR